FTLLALFPIEPRLHFLADPTILVTRKLQWLIVRTTGGYVPVVRSRHADVSLFHHVDHCLEVGGAIAIFPEGQYGPAEGGPRPFRIRPMELKPIGLFEGFSEGDLKKLGKEMREVRHPKGAQMVVHGKDGVGFLVILEGQAEVTTGDGRHRTLGPGDYFGEMA